MNQILEYIQLFRMVWIGGRLGFGKTALATLLAKWLLEQGLADGVVANYPTVFPAMVNGRDDGTLYNRIEIFDEAWQDLDSRTSLTNDRSIGAYMRKWNTFLLLPSIYPVDRRLRVVTISPDHKNLFTGQTVWKWRVAGDTKEDTQEGTFSMDMSKSYGLYATSHIPTWDYGLMARFRHTYYVDTGVRYDPKKQQQKQYAQVLAGGTIENI